MRHRSACEPTARTRARAFPVVPVRARGLVVEGADGRRYLDCLSGAGALALGHNHPVVLEAIRDVLDSGAPLQVPGPATPVGDAFVTELLRTLPPGLAGHARVRFCGPAGTEAPAAAAALARAATGRTDVVALTATCHEAPADPPGTCGAPVTHLPCPRHHRCPFGAGGERGAERAARWAESVLDGREPGVPLPAGAILEPVRAQDGMIPASDTWTRRVRRITADRSIALIADESHTGIGRTGAFWAVEHSGITPDVMILPRAVGGSLPLAVVVHRDDLDVPPPDTDRNAFRGNQLAMAAGAATLAHVRENRLDRHAALLGARMLARLHELVARFPCVGGVRGRGLMIGIEMTDPEAKAAATATGTPAPVPDDCAHRPRRAAAVLADALRRECLRRGLIVGPGAGHPGVVRLLPPLTITEEQAVAVLDRLADAVEAVDRHHPGRVPGHLPCRRG
ncbi:aminotransferase class III-fold pyridoxal phosphate-dependent enzyme [Streptomyces sp. enrichment culture]|uniref:aminotransferase class III-fold pyridoxal phosphate-dependent enzyme n=1 Tax=Streptomyces sp. enrichment culture TaxID=1795815 RepID=UPI003F578941